MPKCAFDFKMQTVRPNRYVSRTRGQDTRGAKGACAPLIFWDIVQKVLFQGVKGRMQIVKERIERTIVHPQFLATRKPLGRNENKTRPYKMTSFSMIEGKIQNTAILVHFLPLVSCRATLAPLMSFRIQPSFFQVQQYTSVTWLQGDPLKSAKPKLRN